MANITQAKQMTMNYLKADIATFWWGAPGVGKSEGIHQISKDEYKGGMVDFRAVLREPVDLRGLPIVDIKAGTSKWLPPEELPNEKRHGKTGILFLDELNAAQAQMQAACFGLVLDRKLGDYRLPDGWQIIAAGNRQSDRSAAQRMPRALANRFAHIDIEPDVTTWVNEYANYYCDPMVIGFVRWRPDQLHDMTAKENMAGTETDERAFPTPRSWARVSKICNVAEHLRFSMVKGLVGEAAASEFEAFVRTYRNLPDLDDIFDKPTKTAVPDEPSALYAISAALARHSDRSNFNAALTYSQRLGREYEIIVCLDATKRDPMLTKTKGYIDFVKRNGDIQIGQFKTAA